MESVVQNERAFGEVDLLTSRPFMSAALSVTEHHAPTTFASLSNRQILQQEQYIINDLLFLLQGVSGYYIKPADVNNETGETQFFLDPSMDISHRSLVDNMLPLCNYMNVILKFTETRSRDEFGQVNQSMAGFIRELFREFLRNITLLEQKQRDGTLTLQQMWYFLQNPSRSLQLLATLCLGVVKERLIGGAVLNFLHNFVQIHQGDDEITKILMSLTKVAGRPFFDMLKLWIYRGILIDPCNEFFIARLNQIDYKCEQANFFESYWLKQFTIRMKMCPVFLKAVAQAALNTGKYVNVLRDCGEDIGQMPSREFEYSLDEYSYVNAIDQVYSSISRLLLQTMFDKFALRTMFTSFKRFFLMSDADFMLHFMDMADEDLCKPKDDIVVSHVNALMEMCVRSSSIGDDALADSIYVAFLAVDINSQLRNYFANKNRSAAEVKLAARSADAADDEATEFRLSGLEAFTLLARVDWPMTLVFHATALDQYQLILRHVFYCRHVERQLCNVWLATKFTKACSAPLCHSYRLAMGLQQQMLFFLQNFIYYVTNVSLAANWRAFMATVGEASNLHEVQERHGSMLESCMCDALLTHPELLRLLQKLLVVCMTFSNFMQRFFRGAGDAAAPGCARPAASAAALAARRNRSAALAARLADDVASERFSSSIDNFRATFEQLLADFFHAVVRCHDGVDEHKLIQILFRLDFNGYYTKKLRLHKWAPVEAAAVATEQRLGEAAVVNDNEPGAV